MAVALDSSLDSPQPFEISRVSLSIGALDVLRGTQLHHRFAPHMHEVFAIGVIDAGASRVRYRGATERARAGALVTISAGETHTGGPDSDLGWSYRMIYPQPGMLRLALGESVGEDESLLFRHAFIDDGEAHAAFDAVYPALSAPVCELATEEAVLRFLRLLSTKHSSRSPRARLTSARADVVRIAREFLDAHFAEPIRLALLAETCGVSPFHLIRLFRAGVGVPPHAYLKQRRVAHAMTMLQRGVPVAGVAYACGFSDQSHLTRAFKATYGFPPGAYRRAVRS